LKPPRLQTPRIGAHVSVAGGLANAVPNAVAGRCETMQLFASNPRAWATRPPDPDGDALYLARLARTGIGPVHLHAPYLVNLASPGDGTWERSAAVTAWTLRRAAELGAAGVVVHAGSDLGAGRERGLARTRAAVLPLLGDDDGPDLLFELTAGARNTIASRFDQMAELLDVLGDHPRVKVCLDTCHAHAAGYDLSDPPSAVKAIDELLATVGDRVPLVHANDSRDPVGAARDRHCEIGRGTIGAAGFAALLAHPGLRGAAFVTETGEPKVQARDVRRLKRLRG
jgi:deoxyribonuclease-4